MKVKINFYLEDPKMESTEITGWGLLWDVDGTVIVEDILKALLHAGLTSTTICEMATKIESER